MSRLLAYTFFSVASTFLAVLHAVSLKPQFYSLSIYLTTAKINVLVLGNLAFCVVLLLGQLVTKLFLGNLTADEVAHVYDNARFAITETCLALTIFREELNLKVLGLFLALLFTKVFHWLAQLRVDNLARLEGVSFFKHFRLVSLISWLIAVDTGAVALIAFILYTTEKPSVLFLFAFEYMILAVTAIATFNKYILLRVDGYYEGRWNNKVVYLFAIELVHDLLHLSLYLCFFGIISVFYGLPLHLIREIYVAFTTLKERIIKYYQYRKITKNMNERFPVVLPHELENVDNTCIVCREDMTIQVRRLPCGHMFHFWCLRRWLESDTRCPTCRANISLRPVQTPLIVPVQGQPANNIVPPPNIVTPANQNISMASLNLNQVQSMNNVFSQPATSTSSTVSVSFVPNVNQLVLPPMLADSSLPLPALHLELMMRQSILLQAQINQANVHLKQLADYSDLHEQMKTQLIQMLMRNSSSEKK